MSDVIIDVGSQHDEAVNKYILRSTCACRHGLPPIPRQTYPEKALPCQSKKAAVLVETILATWPSTGQARQKMLEGSLSPCVVRSSKDEPIYGPSKYSISHALNFRFFQPLFALFPPENRRFRTIPVNKQQLSASILLPFYFYMLPDAIPVAYNVDYDIKLRSAISQTVTENVTILYPLKVDDLEDSEDLYSLLYLEG